jgi:FtsX-like permease family
LPQWADGKRHHYQLIFGDLPAARVPGGSREIQLVRWLGAVAGLVLLVACGNVGNLLLVRGLRRSSELALKTALGATRSRLIREVLIEAGVLASATGIVALCVVWVAGTVVGRLLLPPVLNAARPLDAQLVIIRTGVCIVASLLLGLVPALRLSSANLVSPLRTLHLRRSSRTIEVFVAIQIALSVPAIVGASLFSASMWRTRQFDFGFDTTHVIMLSINAEDMVSAADNHAAHQRIQERLARLPQIAATTLVAGKPFQVGYCDRFSGWTAARRELHRSNDSGRGRILLPSDGHPIHRWETVHGRGRHRWRTTRDSRQPEHRPEVLSWSFGSASVCPTVRTNGLR